MENLPQDVFLSVLDDVLEDESRTDKARYATVSRRFQYAVERRTFRELHIKTSGAEYCFSRFLNFFRLAEEYRKAFVRQITLKVALPDYDDDACARHETEEEQERNTEVFSNSVHGLFRVLECLDKDSDLRKSGGLALFIATPFAAKDHHHSILERDIRDKRFRESLLEVRDPEKLPAVSIVRRLSCGWWHLARSISPAATMAITAKLVGLRNAKIQCRDWDYFDIATRRKSRVAVAQVFSSINHDMDELNFSYDPTCIYSESYNTPNVLFPSWPVDPLGVALRNFVQRTRLKELRIRTYISPEMFWPSDGDAELPFWLDLKKLFIFSPCFTPDGHWYFMEDPAIASHAEFVGEENADIDPNTIFAEDKRKRNTFRTIPDPEKMNPLLIAMARAVRRASALRHCWFFMQNGLKLNFKYLANRKELNFHRAFQFDYFAAGVHENDDDVLFHKARVIWKVGDWRPDEEVQRHWREAVGPDGLLVFRDVEFSDNDSDDDSEEDSEEEWENDNEGSDGNPGEEELETGNEADDVNES